MLSRSLCILLLSAPGWAQITHLEITATTIDPATGLVTLELRNESLKAVTAYMLEIRQLDASNQVIFVVNIGFDCLSYDLQDDTSRTSNVIQPGAMGTRTLQAAPNAFSVSATVIGVAYSDHTAEGPQNAVAPLFGQRAIIAGKLTKVVALLREYPATSEAFRANIQAARDVDPARVNSALHELLRVPLGAATDTRHPLPLNVSMPDRERWRAAVSALSDEAAFWTMEAQEAK